MITKTEKLKVGVYTRASKDDQTMSIENQSQMFNLKIAQNDWILHKTYVDAGISGTKIRGRNAFIEMIADAKEGKFDILLAKSYSRFARNMRESLQVIADLIEANVRIIFVEDGLDSGSKEGMSRFGIFSWLSEEEARRTSLRIKEVWNYYDSKGKMHSPVEPFGYDYDTTSKNFVVNEKEAITVRRIFELYAGGKGCRYLEQLLRDENVPTKRGGKWDKSSILQMIRNRVYTGALVQGMSRSIDVTLKARKQLPQEDWVIHENHHPAIIDRELWEAAQEAITIRSNKAKAEGSRHSSTALYSNLIFCGICGKSFIIKRAKRSRNYAPYYSCSLYEQSGAVRAGHSRSAIYEEDLNELLRVHMAKLIKDELEPIKAFFSGYRQAKLEVSDKSLLNSIEKQLTEQSQLSMSLLSAYSQKLISDDLYKMQCQQLENKLAELNKEKEELSKRISEKKVVVDKEQIITDTIKKLASLDSNTWTNAMLKTIINRIVIKENKEVHVHFRFSNTYNQIEGQSKCFNLPSGDMLNPSNLLHSYTLVGYV
jgi:DNA invertase Pin-like site-specific DNA recombinase